MEFRHALIATLAGPLLAMADEAGLRRLGVNLTSDPAFASKSLCPV